MIMNRLELLMNNENSGELEKMYRDNKTAFKKEFNLLYPGLGGNKLAGYWNERLNFKGSELSWGSTNELAFVIIASLLAGIIAKFPTIFNIDPEFFYLRNSGLVVFPILTTYFIWKKSHSTKKIIFAGLAFLIALI